MFFNKYKKIGKDVGLSAKHTLLTPFNDKKLSPPLGFFEDVYVYAFSASYLHNHLAHLGSLEWKGEDVSKAMETASNILDPTKEFFKFQFECYASGLAQTLETKEEFIKGKYHADLILRIFTGTDLRGIPPEIKEPLLVSAKKEKDKLTKNLQIKSLNKYGDSQIAGIILGFTFWQHIDNNYLNN